MKAYHVRIDASPKYPMPDTFEIQASCWHVAVARAVKAYWKKYGKRIRGTTCVTLTAHSIMKVEAL